VERVEREFQVIVQNDPHSPLAQFVLGLTAFRSGRYEAALAHIDRAMEADRSNPDFHAYRAASLAALGAGDEAAASYRRALAIAPGHVEALHGLGRLLVARGRAEEAEAHLREALARDPEHPRVLADLGDLLGARGNLVEAEAHLRLAARLEPGDAAIPRNLGNVCMRLGRPGDAEAALRRAIQLRPGDADAHNDLGIVLSQLGRLDAAIGAYSEAVRLRPEFADAHNNLGNALRNTGRLDEAVASFRTALRIRPGYPEAHNNLAIALRNQGKLDEAIAAYHQALAARPTYAEAHNNLGFALSCCGRLEAAVECYRQAVRLRPDYFEAYFNLANALADMGRLHEAEDAYRRSLAIKPDDPLIRKNLGIALTRQNKVDEAVAEFKTALEVHPRFHEAYNDLAIAYSRQGRYPEAIDAYRQALSIKPDYAEVYNNLGNAMRNTGQFDESIECYRTAIEIRSDYADAHNNLGIAYAEAARFDEAVASYSECIRLHPNHVDAHMNRALTWLRKGDYAQGWAEYEWRWKKRSLTNRPLTEPLWNGFPLKGRRILLITEQGFGDSIQFVRYCPVLKAQGATVILECPERLVKLLSRCPGIDHLVAQGQPLPPYDVYAPLLTIPGLVGTSPESAPAAVPYLHMEPDLVERWRSELAGIEGFKVGINWQGNPEYAGDRHRSIPLKHFEALARIPGVRLISLQKNHGVEQLKEHGDRLGIIDLGAKLDLGDNPFLDTAAAMLNLDLFITSDTAVVHLAGALGVPTWMALSTAADWRWMTGRDDNPWYPKLRLFRQDDFMVWEPVFSRIAEELGRVRPRPRRSGSLSVDSSPGELLDKISILQIKAERIGDPDKLRNVRLELVKLEAARDRSIDPSSELDELARELRAVNESLWRIEDEIRACEREQDFGPRFVELARLVYQVNDRRAAVKRAINGRLGSEIVEEKQYQTY